MFDDGWRGALTRPGLAALLLAAALPCAAAEKLSEAAASAWTEARKWNAGAVLVEVSATANRNGLLENSLEGSGAAFSFLAPATGERLTVITTPGARPLPVPGTGEAMKPLPPETVDLSVAAETAMRSGPQMPVVSGTLRMVGENDAARSYWMIIGSDPARNAASDPIWVDALSGQVVPAERVHGTEKR